VQELFALAFEHLVDRDAGPARDDLRDMRLCHRFFQHRALRLFFGFDELLFKLGNDAIGKLGGAIELSGALRLRQFVARRLKLFLDLLCAGELRLLGLP